MFPWGAIIGLAGQAVSGIMSARNNRAQQQAADAEAARQQAAYEAKANEDPLARSENQRLLNQYDREAQRQVERARNMAVITGATPEQSAAVQKGVAEGRANLMGDMAAGASARKDRYEQMAENARHQKALDDQARLAARQETYANLAANAASAVGGIIDSYSAKVSSDTNTEDNNTSNEGGDGFKNGVNQRKLSTGLAEYTRHDIKMPKKTLQDSLSPGILSQEDLMVEH